MLLIILVGYPASGKSTYTKSIANAATVSRDEQGGNMNDMLHIVEKHMKDKTEKIVLDSKNMTKDARKPFIELGKKYSYDIKAVYIKSSIEDCQLRCLRRMYDKYKEVYFTGKAPKDSQASKDPGVFPPAVLFSSRKKLEEPTKEEGFSEIMVLNAQLPKWDGRRYRKKAVFFDVDGTLRFTDDLPLKYPTKPNEVKLLTDKNIMKKVLEKYKSEGYIFFGVSNQSGISKQKLTHQEAEACMDKTRELLELKTIEMPITFCPHNSAPITCYCRKPQMGMIISLAEKYKVNPLKSIYVGDMTTDETLAKRMNMKFIHAKDFWT